jgi:hypothetical protein
VKEQGIGNREQGIGTRELGINACLKKGLIDDGCNPSGAKQATEEFSLIANCESFVSGHDFSRAANAAKSTRALQAAEKGLRSSENPEERPAGAKAHVDSIAFAARLKSCPVTKLSKIAGEKSFSAACLAPEVRFWSISFEQGSFSAGAKARSSSDVSSARLKSCPDTERIVETCFREQGLDAPIDALAVSR